MHILTSQAYYADRLCDRGRAYIREYIVGNKERRQELHNARKQWAPGFAALRERLFGKKEEKTQDPAASGSSSAGTMGGRKERRKKTEDEEVYDIVEREMMDAKARKWVMKRVERLWGDVGRNPWHERLDGTMFWM
jgi:eukaryotic translation initiation factor 2C